MTDISDGRTASFRWGEEHQTTTWMMEEWEWTSWMKFDEALEPRGPKHISQPFQQNFEEWCQLPSCYCDVHGCSLQVSLLVCLTPYRHDPDKRSSKLKGRVEELIRSGKISNWAIFCCRKAWNCPLLLLTRFCVSNLIRTCTHYRSWEEMSVSWYLAFLRKIQRSRVLYRSSIIFMPLFPVV